jgi:holliday junction DNA helicase RuvB
MENYIQSSLEKQDDKIETTLRPQKFNDFIGQEKTLKRLSIHLGAAKKRNEAISHTLFSGPPGLGKTTLANIISKELGTNLITTSGPILEKAADLAGVLTSLKKGDILFIDEIHRLPKCVEEYLYPAMEDFSLDLMIDSGVNARSVEVKLNPFTLIGATTRSGLLSAPLRSRFLFNARLDYYEPKDLVTIIKRSAILFNIEIDATAAMLIAKVSRGTPRIANNILSWVRDYTQMHGSNKINQYLAKKSLEMLSIDSEGLDEVDKKILSIIIDNYNGGPVGLQTISLALGEEPNTINEIYEPYLVTKGFLKLTKRGREATRFAYKHLNKENLIKNDGASS